MLKKTTLLPLLVLLLTTAYGQQRSIPHVPNGGKAFDHQQMLMQKLHQEMSAETEAAPVQSVNDGPIRPYSGGPAGKTSAFTVQPVGKATNAFTIINNRVNQVYTVDRPGTNNDFMGWIRRHSTIDFTGSPETTANGVLRTDFFSSTCPGPGASNGWRIDVGPFNPIPYGNSARARYPQALIHVPTGSDDNFADYRLIWTATCTDGNRWGNLTWGVARDLCGVGVGTSSSASPSATERSSFGFLNNRQDNLTLIPGGLCEGRKGEFWKFDQCFSGPTGGGGRSLDSLYLFKGTLNAANNTVNWVKYRTFTINLWRERSGRDNTNFSGYMPGGPNIAFSPDGRWGWAAAAFDNDEPAAQRAYEANPHFWYTNDFGVTWNGPIRVPVMQMNEIRDNIRFTFRNEQTGAVDTSTAIPSQLGDHEIVVDRNGNPHYIAVYANASSARPNVDSIRFFSGGRNVLVDITTNDQGRTWQAVRVATIYKPRGTVAGTSNFNFDNFIQAARDPEGEYVFASWVDDTTVSSGTFNMNPDLFTRGIRVADVAMTPEDNTESRNNATYRGKIYFPTMAPIALTGQGDGGREFTLPTVFADIPNGENNETNFNFITDRKLNAAQFVLPAIDLEISQITSPSERVCFAEDAAVTVVLRNNGTGPIEGSFDIAYSVNNGTPVVETITLTEPMVPGATMNYTFESRASIAQSGNYEFFIETRVFNDNVFANHRRRLNVVNFGGVNREIFSATTLSGCGSLEINTGLEGFTTTWTLDGEVLPNTSSRLNLTQNDLTGGQGTLQISVTNPQCTPSSLSDEVTVRIDDIPNLTVSSNAICQANAPLRATLTTTPNSEYVYSWAEIGGTRNLSTNDIALDRTGRFTARIANRLTGCDTSTVVDLRIWNINLRLQAPPQVCEPLVLDPDNETTGPGVIYRWEVNGQLAYQGTTPQFSTSVDTGGTAAKRYRVTALDPLGCNASSPSSSEVSVATFTKNFDANAASRDTLLSDFIGNYEIGPIPAQVCCCRNLVLRDASKNGMTPITGRYWVFEGDLGINAPNAGLLRSGEKGTPTSPGTEEIVIRIDCSSRYATRTYRVVYTVQSGPCSTEVRYNITSQRPNAFSLCASPDVSAFPNIDRQQNLDNATGWDSCRIVSRPDRINPLLGVAVYPNPGTGTYQLSMALERPSDIGILIYDLSGRMVWTKSEFAGNTHTSTLDLTQLPAGIYLVKVQTPEGYQTIRLIQQ